jgi:transposase
MTEHSPTIPDDLPTCQEQLRAAWERLDSTLQRLHDLEHQLNETCATTDELQRSYACLKEEYLALKRLLFGPRRERLPEDPGQQHLFDTAAPPSTPPEPAADAAEPTPPRKGRKGHGRRGIPEHLPRRNVVHPVPEEDRVCECGRAKALIGEDVSEQLDYEPGKLIVWRHVYPKYACSCCKDDVTAAETEPSPIKGGLAAPGLLAYVLVSKFATHLPLYRQQDELARQGVFFARSTLCGWLAQCAAVLRPLVALMGAEVLKSRVIQADETPVPVLDPTRDSTRTGYLWPKLGDGDHPYTVYHYTDSRSGEGIASFLKDFEGYLQTDAYVAYESVVSASGGRIIAVGCWAHVRRGFFDARLNQSREVHYVLGLIAQLYDIEDEIREKSFDARLKTRQERSVPVLDRLEKYLREQQPSALPKSQFGQAIGYALNQWEALCRFAEDGRLEISRKNWLFFGSDRGGETAAICFSVLASAKRHRIEPFAYVRALLVALSSPDVDLRSLLPDVWIAAHPEHFLAYRRDEAEAAARARRRRRADRRAKSVKPTDGADRGAEPPAVPAIES